MQKFHKLTLLLTLLSLCVSGLLTFADEQPLFGGAIEVIIKSKDLSFISMEMQRTRLVSPFLFSLDTNNHLSSGIAESFELVGNTIIIKVIESRHSSVRAPSMDEVVSSLKFYLEHKPESPEGIILSQIQGASAWIEGRDSRIRGINQSGNTIKITFKEKTDFLIPALAQIPVITEENTGPFIGSENGFAANIHYFQGRPFIDQAVLTNERSDNTVSPSRSTKISIKYENSPQDIADPQNQLIRYPGVLCTYLIFNSHTDRLNEKQRIKLIRSIDVDSMVEIFFSTTSKKLIDLLPPEFSVNPLTESLDTDTTVTIDKEICIGYTKDNPSLKLAAERIAADLVTTGIQTKTVSVENIPETDKCDFLLLSALIAEEHPEYSLWSFLRRVSATLDIKHLNLPPANDNATWFLNSNRLLKGKGIIFPLFYSPFAIRVPSELKGLYFHPDGTLELSSAWLTP